MGLLSLTNRYSKTDIKGFAAQAGEKAKPAIDKVGELAHDAVEKAKPLAEKAGHAVSDAAHKATDAVKGAIGK